MYNGIIIFGTMGSGKDTLASYMLEKAQCLSNAFHKSVGIHRLGAQVRSTVDFASMWDDDVDNNKREFYQDYAQGMRKIFGKDYWNNLLLTSGWIHDTVFPIIADGRQLSDFKFWKDKGFYTVGIYASEDTRKQRMKLRDGYLPPDKAFVHETELEAQYVSTQLCNTTIENNILTFDELNIEARCTTANIILL